MWGIINFETFVIAGILLNLTPGNDTIFILSRSMAEGRRSGMISVFGITTGSLIHTILAALGLSIIISESLIIFNIIKYAGACYLAYIGYRLLTDKTQLSSSKNPVQKTNTLKKIYFEAVITNILNPKVALFFIAFLPQFLEPGLKNTIVPLLTLGLTFTITGAIWCLVLANFAGIIFTKLKNNKKISWYVNKTCGAVIILLSVKLALTARK